MNLQLGIIGLILCGFLIFFLKYVVDGIWAWEEGRRFVKTSAIPAVTIYSPANSAVFWILSPYIAPYVEALPFGLGHWIRYVKKDYAWYGKGELPRKDLDSDVWWTVGLGGLTLTISDSAVFTELITKPRDFPKALAGYEVLNIFGRNIVTTEGSEWQVHRKITAPPFNERNNLLVFTESIHQASAMIHSFTHQSNGTEKELAIKSLTTWTMTIALHIIGVAGFGLQMKWPVKSIEDDMHEASGMPFPKAVHIVATQTYAVLIYPKWFLRYSPFEFHRTIWKATESFETYLGKMMDNCEPDKTNLLSSIIKNSKGEMTKKEMIGNCFIFIMAGHETTSIVMQTLFILLACEQNIQGDLFEEIDQIFSEHEELDYARDWPKMKKSSAAALEVARLFPPIVNFPKISSGWQTINYRAKNFAIPPGVTIGCDVIGLNRHPESWSPDPHAFRPSRWIIDGTYEPAKNSVLYHEELYRPPKGTFATFSDGARNCLGRKFALVELATVLTIMLKNHRVELVDNTKQGRRNALAKVDERQTSLAMRMFDDVEVKFVRRKN